MNFSIRESRGSVWDNYLNLGKLPLMGLHEGIKSAQSFLFFFQVPIYPTTAKTSIGKSVAKEFKNVQR